MRIISLELVNSDSAKVDGVWTFRLPWQRLKQEQNRRAIPLLDRTSFFPLELQHQHQHQHSSTLTVQRGPRTDNHTRPPRWSSRSSSSRTGSTSSIYIPSLTTHTNTSSPSQRQDPPGQVVLALHRRRENQAQRRSPSPRRPSRPKTPVELRRIPRLLQNHLSSLRGPVLLRVRGRQR